MKASNIEPYFVLYPLPDICFMSDRYGHHKCHDWKKSQKKIRRERRQRGNRKTSKERN